LGLRLREPQCLQNFGGEVSLQLPKFEDLKIEGNIKTVLGTAVAQLLRCCATNRKVAGLIPVGAIGIFCIDIKFFRSHYATSNRNEYQEHFLG